MATWDFESEFLGARFNMRVRAHRYKVNDRIALLLESDMEGDWDSYGPLSINVPEVELPDPERDFIVDHNLSAEAINHIKASGLIQENPLGVVGFGWATSEVYRLTDEGAEWVRLQLEESGGE